MKIIKKVTKILLLLFLLTIIFFPVIKTINVDLSAGGARDPHAHVGEKTLCYNIEDWACDDIPLE